MLIIYSKISEKSHRDIIERYLPTFNNDFQKKILSFRRWKDSQLCVIGRVALLKGLEVYGISSEEINNLRYNDFGKPFFCDQSIFFNISHSGNIAICVLNKESEIGIDIEEIVDINLEDFKSQMTNKEWERVILSDDVRNSFFDYWTQKEAVLKTHGMGLTIPLQSFEVFNNITQINKEKYYLKEVEIDKKYKCYISSKAFIKEISILKI